MGRRVIHLRVEQYWCCLLAEKTLSFSQPPTLQYTEFGIVSCVAGEAGAERLLLDLVGEGLDWKMVWAGGDGKF